MLHQIIVGATDAQLRLIVSHAIVKHDMGGISISRNGQSIHITENGEVLGDKGASVCDSCFVPYPIQETVRIIDDELVLCRRCYLRNRRQQ